MGDGKTDRSNVCVGPEEVAEKKGRKQLVRVGFYGEQPYPKVDVSDVANVNGVIDFRTSIDLAHSMLRARPLLSCSMARLSRSMLSKDVVPI